MANENNKHNKNSENTVPFSNIFDFTDPMLGEKYTKRKEPVVGTPETRKGKEIDKQIPDQKNRGWLSSWEKGRKRVATSPVSFHADEVLPMMEGLFGKSEGLQEPFRDTDGNLFGGRGSQRKGPMYGLPLDVRMKSLLGDVKRGDDIVDCYVRGLETPTRRKTYALQQPPGRSYGLSGPTRDQRDADIRASKAMEDNKELKENLTEQQRANSALSANMQQMSKHFESITGQKPGSKFKSKTIP